MFCLLFIYKHKKMNIEILLTIVLFIIAPMYNDWWNGEK